MPETSRPTKLRIGAPSGKGFPAFHNSAKRDASLHLNDHMNVIGHETPGEQAMSLTVGVEQAAFDECCNLRSTQPTGAEARSRTG
jgi:hypothetical protein